MMTPARRLRPALLALCAGAALLGSTQAPPPPEKSPEADVVMPAELVAIDDSKVDVATLARRQRLVFVTLKAPWCQVCARQLVRFVKILPRLRSCGVSFVVLSPGPAKDLARVKSATGFPYPFVADDDGQLARTLKLEMGEDLMMPAIFTIDAKRRVNWMQTGRSGIYYGDRELMDHLNCSSVQSARLSPPSTPEALSPGP